MIKFVEENKTQYKQCLDATAILNKDHIILNAQDLIPVEFNNELVKPSLSINELGKQLLLAAGEGNLHDIKKLMTKGAPFTSDWLGTSPLHLAAERNHLEVCEALLRAGISRDCRTKVDRTPLHIAAYEGHVEIVKVLLKHGADFDCRDMLNMTPLHWAVQKGHSEVAQVLIRHGAATNIQNKFELTPLDIAQQNNRDDIAAIVNMAVRDPFLAIQHLKVEMDNDSNDAIERSLNVKQDENLNAPIDTIVIQGGDQSTEPTVSDTTKAHVDGILESKLLQHNDSFSESLKYLQEHGITMLPVDEDTILSSAMETGHSVVLTEAGKQALNSIKPIEVVVPKTNAKITRQSLPPINGKKIIKLTREQFLTLSNKKLINGTIKRNGNVVAVAKVQSAHTISNKCKTVPLSSNITTMHKMESKANIESLTKQLWEARKTIEEYKIKLRKKENEVERYKQQLKQFFGEQ